MVFSSLSFLLLFLPLLMTLYFICPNLRWKNGGIRQFGLLLFSPKKTNGKDRF